MSIGKALGRGGVVLAVAVMVAYGGASADGGGNGGSFTDPRDGRKYRTATIGRQTWMAENLNYKTEQSWCYDNDESNCKLYGRLYDFNAAKSACPKGWHLPSRAEWKSAVMTAGGSASIVGKKLKSKSGWNGERGGTDDYGFSTLPGGSRNTDGTFSRVGNNGHWWSASEEGRRAYQRYMYYNTDGVYESAYDVRNGFSARCVQDTPPP